MVAMAEVDWRIGGSIRTRYKADGFSEDDESQKMREFFLPGNQYTLDKLGGKFSR